MNQIKIGLFIAECRKKKNLTQEELGEKLGVSYKAVSKWENGICLPDPSLYEELCNIFNITKDELFSGEHKEKSYSHKIEFIILILSLLIISLSFFISDSNFKTILLGIILIITLFIFNKNINILTKNKKISLKIKIFNNFIIILIPIILLITFLKPNFLNNYPISLIILSLVIILGGVFLYNTPYNKYFGFRLPWTIRDESTWILAHKMLLYFSIPAAIITLVCGYFFNDKIAALVGILSWTLIPGLISGYHYYKKFVK